MGYKTKITREKIERKRIYIVIGEVWFDGHKISGDSKRCIDGAFSSEEKAREYVKQVDRRGHDSLGFELKHEILGIEIDTDVDEISYIEYLSIK